MMPCCFIVLISLASLSSADQQLRGLSDPKSVVAKQQHDDDDDCRVRPDVPFRSQYWEEETVYRKFFASPPKCGGTVVEMGGLDGKSFSNSWFFQYALGWKALLVEALPENYERMVQNRPDAINIFGAMCLGESTQFQASKALASGGVMSDMSERHKEQWVEENATVVEVPCKLVTKTLVDNGIDHVDVFFLDVEGGELSVLQTIDWGKVTIDMFVVEMDGTNHLKNLAVKAILRARGYITPFSMLNECVKKQSQCMPSDIFILEELWLEKQEQNAIAA